MKIVGAIGNQTLWDREKTLFLCSKMTPYGYYEKIFEWVDGLTEKSCVMCCDTTEMEREVLTALLVNNIPTILVITNKFNGENNLQVELALKEKRLLVVILGREKDDKGVTFMLRNTFLINHATHIVAGYIRMNGNVKPLLKNKHDVEYLLGEEPSAIAVEEETINGLWRLHEDKILLRMFYNDKGLHAIKQQIGRSYLAVRQRIRTLTMAEQVLKGREFEEYVLSLFKSNQDEEYSLKEWRGDKNLNGLIPESNHYPDFIFQYRNGEIRSDFAIECKWRKDFLRDGSVDILSQTNVTSYPQFATEKGIPVFIILGLFGQPWEPLELYILPLDIVTSPCLHKNNLLPYRRMSSNSSFHFNPMSRELT